MEILIIVLVIIAAILIVAYPFLPSDKDILIRSIKSYYSFMEQYHCHTGLEPYLNGSVSYEEGDISKYMSKEQFDRLIEITGDDNE